MKVVGRAVKKVIMTNCLICGSRLEVEDTDNIEWFIENEFGKVACPVCGCKHVPVLGGHREKVVYEHGGENF